MSKDQWKETTKGDDSKVFTKAATIGRNFLCQDAHEIELHYHFNGSGDKAFGGADKWPVVHAEISFQEGQEAERDRMVEKIKETVDQFFAGPSKSLDYIRDQIIQAKSVLQSLHEQERALILEQVEQQWHVKKGSIVECGRSSRYKVAYVRTDFVEGKPWLGGRKIKTDGTPSRQVHQLYDYWTLVQS